MPPTPSDDETRIKRIQTLCVEISKSVRTSRQQREAALKLAREALKLAKCASTAKRPNVKAKGLIQILGKVHY